MRQLTLCILYIAFVEARVIAAPRRLMEGSGDSITLVIGSLEIDQEGTNKFSLSLGKPVAGFSAEISRFRHDKSKVIAFTVALAYAGKSRPDLDKVTVKDLVASAKTKAEKILKDQFSVTATAEFPEEPFKEALRILKKENVKSVTARHLDPQLKSNGFFMKSGLDFASLNVPLTNRVNAKVYFNFAQGAMNVALEAPSTEKFPTYTIDGLGETSLKTMITGENIKTWAKEYADKDISDQKMNSFIQKIYTDKKGTLIF